MYKFKYLKCIPSTKVFHIPSTYHVSNLIKFRVIVRSQHGGFKTRSLQLRVSSRWRQCSALPTAACLIPVSKKRKRKTTISLLFEAYKHTAACATTTSIRQKGRKRLGPAVLLRLHHSVYSQARSHY